MTRVIAVANQKGGVGKTTTTMNLGYALVERGRRILLIDMDSQQAGLTMAMGINVGTKDKMSYKTMADVLGSHKSSAIPLTAAMVRLNKDLIVAASSDDLAGAAIGMIQRMGREQILHKKLTDHLEASVLHYDYVLIDCPPSLNILTINALVAADEVLVPVQTEFLCLNATEAIFRTILQVRENLNGDLKILGFLPTLMRRTVHHQTILQVMQERLGQYKVFSPIPMSIKAADAIMRGQSVFAKGNKIAEAYAMLAMEVERV